MHPDKTSKTSIGPLTWLAAGLAVAFAGSTAYLAAEVRSARRSGPSVEARVAGEAPEAEAAGDERAVPGGDELVRLRRENQQLRRRLWEQTVAEAAARPEAPREEPAEARPPEGWRSQDPERRARMMARREERRAEMTASMQDQLASVQQRLEAVRAAGDTPEARREAELLGRMESTLSQMRDLGDRWSSISQLPDAERRTQADALADQGRTLYRQLAAIRAEDRNLQVQALGAQLGLSAEQSAQLAGGVEKIVKETDPRPMRPQGGGGRPRQGGERPAE